MRLRSAARSLVSALRPLNWLALRLSYPGMRVHSSARLPLPRRISYGTGVIIAAGAEVIVHAGGSLTLGDGCLVLEQVVLNAYGAIDLGAAVSLQRRCYVEGIVRIGRNTLFAPNVFVSSGTHHYKIDPAAYIRDQDTYVLSGKAGIPHHRPVDIGDDCWIGINVVIVPGVTIGKGCIIGANSVVTRDIPPYAVAAGTPATVVGQRLPFAPPVSVRATEPADRPYFYSGFRLGEAERTADLARTAGVIAGGAFALMLDAAGTHDRVALRARSLTGKPEHCRLGSATVTLGTEQGWVVFPLPDPRVSRLDFVVPGSPADGTVVSLSEARLLRPGEAV